MVDSDWWTPFRKRSPGSWDICQFLINQVSWQEGNNQWEPTEPSSNSWWTVVILDGRWGLPVFIIISTILKDWKLISRYIWELLRLYIFQSSCVFWFWSRHLSFQNRSAPAALPFCTLSYYLPLGHPMLPLRQQPLFWGTWCIEHRRIPVFGSTLIRVDLTTTPTCWLTSVFQYIMVNIVFMYKHLLPDLWKATQVDFGSFGPELL